MSFFSSLFSSEKEGTTQVGTLLELTNYAANLASNMASVDPLLDEVRRITATTAQPGTLSVEESRSLINVYLQIEDYLINKEPIRSFSKDELRARVTSKLREQIESYEVNLKQSHNA